MEHRVEEDFGPESIPEPPVRECVLPRIKGEREVSALFVKDKIRGLRWQSELAW
ncbi:tyrosine-protein phosphatase non-receptor type 5 isoform 1 [Corchorus olitorius]|uniref:Tyrosine-protein phosphatase non-receptor type 5 isoform 1 n=1 Tax=Corchorus olitorius TaxID=93759 RepID=A0A1R3G6P9_9ROSI|nr:tyrosine-protein phosphatase non-receptor type 5 isoform 1 [Corchorus olitorius]